MLFFTLLPNTILFTITLVITTAITISTSNWAIVWLSMELNLMCFAPLLALPSSPSSTNPMTYLLAQGAATPPLVMAMIMLTSNTLPLLTSSLLISSLLIKMGAAPAHFWLPPIANKAPFHTLFLLLTWQKLSPLMLLSYLMITPHPPIILAISCTNSLVGALGGVNQTRIRPLLTYSSINHMGWMTAPLMFSSHLVITYFSTYLLMTLTVMTFISPPNPETVTNFNSNNPNLNWTISILTMLNFASLNGMPPLPGFIPKWMIISTVTPHNQFLMMFLILCSLISTMFYMSMLFNSLTSSLKLQPTNTTLISPITMVSITPAALLPLTPLMLLPL